MRYVGIFPDKSIIIKDSLLEIQNVPYLEYILTEELKDKNWPCYNLIDKDGSPAKLKIGKYEVVDIEYIDKKWNNGRRATIFENETKKTYRITFQKKWVEFFTHELIPILNELNLIDDLDLYIKINQCRNENAEVKECIDALLEVIKRKNELIYKSKI